MPRSRPTEVRPVARLGADDRAAMFALFERHFECADARAFTADLDEKDAAVLVWTPDGALAGFSTLVRQHLMVDGKRVSVTFSGDTIVAAGARQAAHLPRALSRHIFAEARRAPDTPAYWFLLSSGYKTYRLMPHLFETFVPGLRPPPTEQEQAVLDAVAGARFGDGYDGRIVRLAHPTPLRAGVADLTPHRLRDAHVAFFADANPGHIDGDELACLTHVHPANLTAAGLRTVGADLTDDWPGATHECAPR